ncbi:MAG: hypothetical protein JNL38_28555, partial [Myxococcales bacterium]|nr:hypothetical protein [Myxococcales bacterium]
MRTLSAIVVASAALAGCSANMGATNDVDADSVTPSTAVVVLERTSQGPDTTRVGAVARFVHTRSGQVDERALRTVGAQLDLPAPGACAALAGDDDVAARGVELADVGAISVEAGDRRALLTARQVPDPVGRVTGVFYVGSSETGAHVAPGGRVALKVAGSQDVGAFTVVGQAPADLGDLRIGGQDAARGVVSLAAGAPVELTWDASDDPRDVVYVDVGGRVGAVVTRCAFADSGRATLGATVLATDEGSLAVHRVRRERFAARGVEPGELRFDFARVAVY